MENMLYQYSECGSRTDENPRLIISLKKNHVHTCVEMNCDNCVSFGQTNQYNFITPCCRKRICIGCHENCMWWNKCILCKKEKFNVFPSK